MEHAGSDNTPKQHVSFKEWRTKMEGGIVGLEERMMELLVEVETLKRTFYSYIPHGPTHTHTHPTVQPQITTTSPQVGSTAELNGGNHHQNEKGSTQVRNRQQKEVIIKQEPEKSVKEGSEEEVKPRGKDEERNVQRKHSEPSSLAQPFSPAGGTEISVNKVEERTSASKKRRLTVDENEKSPASPRHSTEAPSSTAAPKRRKLNDDDTEQKVDAMEDVEGNGKQSVASSRIELKSQDNKLAARKRREREERIASTSQGTDHKEEDVQSEVMDDSREEPYAGAVASDEMLKEAEEREKAARMERLKQREREFEQNRNKPQTRKQKGKPQKKAPPALEDNRPASRDRSSDRDPSKERAASREMGRSGNGEAPRQRRARGSRERSSDREKSAPKDTNNKGGGEGDRRRAGESESERKLRLDREREEFQRRRLLEREQDDERKARLDREREEFQRRRQEERKRNPGGTLDQDNRGEVTGDIRGTGNTEGPPRKQLSKREKRNAKRRATREKGEIDETVPETPASPASGGQGGAGGDGRLPRQRRNRAPREPERNKPTKLDPRSIKKSPPPADVNDEKDSYKRKEKEEEKKVTEIDHSLKFEDDDQFDLPDDEEEPPASRADDDLFL